MLTIKWLWFMDETWDLEVTSWMRLISTETWPTCNDCGEGSMNQTYMIPKQTNQNTKEKLLNSMPKQKKLLVFNRQLIIVLQFFGLLDTIIWKCFNSRMLVVTVWPRIVKRNWFNQPRYFFYQWFLNIGKHCTPKQHTALLTAQLF